MSSGHTMLLKRADEWPGAGWHIPPGQCTCALVEQDANNPMPSWCPGSLCAGTEPREEHAEVQPGGEASSGTCLQP